MTIKPCWQRNFGIETRWGTGLVAVLAAIGLYPLGLFAADPSTATPPARPELTVEWPVGARPGQIGVRADVPNLDPEGPDAIAASPQGEVFLLDSVNGRIVRIVPSAEPPPSIAIPEAERATDLVVTDDFFYVLDALGRQVLKYDAEGRRVAAFPVSDPELELAGSTTLNVLANDAIRIRLHGAEEVALDPAPSRGGGSGLITSTAQGTVESRFRRRSDTAAQVELAGRGRGADAPATLAVDGKEFLASAELVAVDARGRYYLLAEEIKTAVPEFAVHTALARYSPSGQLEAVADIPVATAVYLPNRYLAVTPAGDAYFLRPLPDQVQVIKLAFAPRQGISDPDAGLGPTAGSRSAPPPVDAEFETRVRGAYLDDQPPVTRGPGKGISRERILANARRYLQLDWTLGPRNYSHGKIPSKCAPPDAQWRRPRHLNGQVDRKIRAVPYKWGGYDSLSRFAARLKAGDLAGDICTCRQNRYGYCITPKATGVDCSGFVSRTLEERYHTTSSLGKITQRLPGFRDLRPGDILNRAGRHVRLFVGFADKGPLVVNTIESSVSCGGVCAASYTRIEAVGLRAPALSVPGAVMKPTAAVVFTPRRPRIGSERQNRT